MKKLFLMLFVLASLACSNYVMAARVDLQPINVYFVDENDSVYNHQQVGLYVCIYNYGPDSFQGLFSIDLYAIDGQITRLTDIEGSIAVGKFSTFKVSLLKSYDHLVIDPENVFHGVNNTFYFEENKPQIKIIVPWSETIPQTSYTWYVLPNESFMETFSLIDLNKQFSIIGVNGKLWAYDFPLTDDNSRFKVGFPYVQRGPGSYDGGTYYTETNNDSGFLENPIRASFQWMANSSASVVNQFWLGAYLGTTKEMPVGSRGFVTLEVGVALTNKRESSYVRLNRTIEVIDRIRGDVNDDGVVDERDLKILNNVVINGTYNPWVSRKNMYVKEGLNYGAGIILFSTPDFVSNCLLNIWIHAQNDPLVQGLGIGKLMSDATLRTKSGSIKSIPNTFQVSKDELNIYAPEANLYNVTANLKSGKLFQVTGKMGEKIILPSDVKNLKVETVKLQGNLATLSPNLSSKNAVSVYPNPFTDYINVKGLDGETIRIININGQVLYSTVPSETELRISSNSWPKGVYLVSLTSKSGKTRNFKIIK